MRVLLFASYAETLGLDAIELTFDSRATVADAIDRLRALPGGERLPPKPLCAVNLSARRPDAPLRAATNWPCCRLWLAADMVYLTSDPIELGALLALGPVARARGVACFLGTVRNHHDGREVLRLEYSAYGPMAEAECARIVAEAESRWDVAIALQHRLGDWRSAIWRRDCRRVGSSG